MGRPRPNQNIVLQAVMAKARELGFEPTYERGKKHPKILVATPNGTVTVTVAETGVDGPLQVKQYTKKLIDGLRRARVI